jgi:ABC-2 type transport system ATP-binding protein
MEEAQALADRIVITNEGCVMAVGTLAELENMTGKKGLEDVFVSIVERME